MWPTIVWWLNGQLLGLVSEIKMVWTHSGSYTIVYGFSIVGTFVSISAHFFVYFRVRNRQNSNM